MRGMKRIEMIKDVPVGTIRKMSSRGELVCVSVYECVCVEWRSGVG